MSEVDQGEVIRNVIAAADGEIVGRIRLQKIMYLLEKMGLRGGFKFAYHHFGPFSQAVADAVELEVLLGGHVNEEKRSHGAGSGFFSVFTCNHDALEKDMIGALPAAQVAANISKMKRFSSAEIEIAATIDWLRTHESIEDWQHELKLRKGSKANSATVERALSLLKELGLLETAG